LVPPSVPIVADPVRRRVLASSSRTVAVSDSAVPFTCKVPVLKRNISEDAIEPVTSSVPLLTVVAPA